MPAAMSAAGRVRPAAVSAARGLVRALVGADPAPARRWRSAWHRRAAHGALAAGTLALTALSLASLKSLTSGFVNFAVVRFPAPARRGLRPGIGRAGALQVRVGVGSTHFTADWRITRGNVVSGATAALHGAGFSITRAGPPLTHVAPTAVQSALFAPAATMVLAVLIALMVVTPLPLAARYPLLGWRLAWLGMLLVPLAGVAWWGGWPWDPVQILVLLVVFCAAGARHQRSTLWWMWAITLVPWWLSAASGPPGIVAGALGTATLTAAAVAVNAVSSRRRAQLALADQAERAELEQARRAVLEERARIARELHDVVAHHMSLIAVRAETAPYRLTGLPGPALAEFASLSGGAREALADMRKLLGLLRHDQPADLNLTPQPQLDDLPALIGTARRAGMGVHLSQPAAPSHIPPPVGVCAYRIVQESLSNASRHAPGAPVTVTIGHDNNTGAVTLRVTNGPTAPPGHTTQANGNRTATSGTPPANSTNSNSPPATTAPASPARDGHGHGLAGMRERVALLGGSLSAGPSPDGGFTVRAVLPLAQAALQPPLRTGRIAARTVRHARRSPVTVSVR
jgi:signal transduction histidine kinase